MMEDSDEINLIKKRFNFSLLIQQLTEFRQDSEKMRFLFDLKADFYRNYETIKQLVENKAIESNTLNFGDFCQIQIDKIKELSNLSKQDIEKDLMSLQRSELHSQMIDTGLERILGSLETENEFLPKIDKKRDRTLDRVTLFLNYLFAYAGVKCPNTQKAEIIEFLTAYSDKQTIKLFSEFEREKLKVIEKEEISEKFYNDMQTVRKYFERLGLTKIAAKIDEDLGN